jgi:hypothetical protein
MSYKTVTPEEMDLAASKAEAELSHIPDEHMEFHGESVWKKHLQKRTIKEINAIRTKGVMMENAKEFIINAMDMRQVGTFSSGSFGYYEAYYENAYGDRLAWASARIGIPTLTVSLIDNQDWLWLRNRLREKGFVR